MHSPPPRVVTLVLCTPAGEVLGQLPPFQASLPWWQEAQDLVAQARDDHGVDVTILRILDASLPAPPGGAVTYLAQVDGARAGGLPLSGWPGVLEPHPLRLPYAEPGGPSRELAWAEAALEDQGIVRTGRPQQVRTWNLSSLWRIPVEGGSVWLKCVPPFFAHEGAVISRLHGGPVPQLLAHQAGRVLMPEIPGEDLYGAQPPTLLTLVSMLVSLQAEWRGREDELLALGLPDWRGDALTVAIESVMRRTWPELVTEDRGALTDLLEELPRRFASLAECGLPDSLVHGDFAPGNARGNEDSIVLLDWGDCGVGHPLLDMSAFVDRIPAESVAPVRSHWALSWRQAIPGSEPTRAAEILEPIAAARQAVVYQGFLDRIEPSEHPYHRADPAEWLHRAAELARRSGSKL
ncbi:MAG TPA: phosphotransferase [Nocardioides sp.]|uniref:phosphotransferase n=1 Tax=Nocardioides sp. TaxID=35761 RepID=UPI002E3328DC|nr:phosphotransferase [Nocardioides sp.]HEX5090354.1 phosphotransferase [Nocardioides sp.]